MMRRPSSLASVHAHEGHVSIPFFGLLGCVRAGVLLLLVLVGFVSAGILVCCVRAGSFVCGVCCARGLLCAGSFVRGVLCLGIGN